MKVTKNLYAILKSVTIFSGLSEDEVKEICSKCSSTKGEKGNVIIEQDTEATEIFILLKGRLKIILNIREAPIELAEMGPGHCIGEASVVGVQRHSASVVLTKDSEFIVLSRKALMEIYSENKDVFSILILNIARELARRLYKTDHILAHYLDNKNQIR
jgi:CRP-like cAMP-binding protein